MRLQIIRKKITEMFFEFKDQSGTQKNGKKYKRKIIIEMIFGFKDEGGTRENGKMLVAILRMYYV